MIPTLSDLVKQHQYASARRVQTPLGPGYLWQVFLTRAGVVLDCAPDKLAFLDPVMVEPVSSNQPEVILS